MAIVTSIANLSQTASLNGPDGSVDPPSTLDDQDRYLGSFIAMLRDGVGFTAGAAVVALGFTPVRQGGLSSGTTTNMVSIGYNATLGKLVCAVDTNQFGNKWPIDITGQASNVLGLNGTNFTFNWTDPGGGAGQYVLAADTAGTMFVRPQAALNVANANNAYACSGNAATCSNASAVNGISGWSYSNQNYNPPYLWATAGNGNSQFLVQPGNLSVNYANSAGSAPANGGTASNANHADRASNSDNADAFQGRVGDYWINNANSAVRNLRNNATIQMLCGVQGVGDMFWGASTSDARLKKDIADTAADSLAQIERMRFVGFNWRNDLGFEIGDDTFNPIGIIAQEAELIEPKWISNAGTWKQPDLYPMLMSAMHAIQQLNAKVAKLSQLITGGS